MLMLVGLGTVVDRLVLMLAELGLMMVKRGLVASREACMPLTGLPLGLLQTLLVVAELGTVVVKQQVIVAGMNHQG